MMKALPPAHPSCHPFLPTTDAFLRLRPQRLLAGEAECFPSSPLLPQGQLHQLLLPSSFPSSFPSLPLPQLLSWLPSVVPPQHGVPSASPDTQRPADTPHPGDAAGNGNGDRRNPCAPDHRSNTRRVSLQNGSSCVRACDASDGSVDHRSDTRVVSARCARGDGA